MTAFCMSDNEGGGGEAGGIKNLIKSCEHATNLHIYRTTHYNGIHICTQVDVGGGGVLGSTCTSSFMAGLSRPELEFLNNLWGLGTELEQGSRTGQSDYTSWRNWFLGIDSWAP
jgi:hypothetical protein